GLAANACAPFGPMRLLPRSRLVSRARWGLAASACVPAAPIWLDRSSREVSWARWGLAANAWAPVAPIWLPPRSRDVRRRRRGLPDSTSTLSGPCPSIRTPQTQPARTEEDRLPIGPYSTHRIPGRPRANPSRGRHSAGKTCSAHLRTGWGASFQRQHRPPWL